MPEGLQDLLTTEWGGTLLNLIVIAVILIVMSWVFRRRKERQHVLLEQLALEYNGTVRKGGLFSFPRLMLSSSYGEIRIYPTPGGRNTPPKTYLSAGMPSEGEGYGLAIARINPVDRLGGVLGRKYVRINSPAFDEFFVCRSSDNQRVMNFLTLEIQSRFLGVKEWNPRLEIKQRKLVFSVARLLETRTQYKEFIDMGHILLKRVYELG